MRTRHEFMWRTAAGAVSAVLTLTAITGCGLPRPDNSSTAARTSQTAQATGTASVQPDAHYPADMDHLDDILASGDGHTLPQDAEITSVSPATNFATRVPNGWGYIIAFTATDTNIRTYVTTHIGLNGEIIERYPTVRPENKDLEDVDLNSITNPWNTNFGDAILLLERPLGRGWLIIRDSTR